MLGGSPDNSGCLGNGLWSGAAGLLAKGLKATNVLDLFKIVFKSWNRMCGPSTPIQKEIFFLFPIRLYRSTYISGPPVWVPAPVPRPHLPPFLKQRTFL
jgi:hypothetical protein